MVGSEWSKPRVIVFGTGQIAEVAQFYLEYDGGVEVVGFAVDGVFKETEYFNERPVVAWESLATVFSPEDVYLFAPTAFKRADGARRTRYESGKAMGFSFWTYISPNARYYGSAVGENCFILEDNVIQPFTQIGDNVVLWSGNHVGHHSVIKSHCFVASHVVISGSVKIGEEVFLGVNATVRDNVRIGAQSVIGAGAFVSRDIEAERVVFAPESRFPEIKSSRLRRI